VGTQTVIQNAYLEGDTLIIAALSEALTLPYQTSDIRLVDLTNGQAIPITSLDTAYNYQAVIVSDFQHLVGVAGDWNTTDPHTRLNKIHANLYQYSTTLPAGTYHYKVSFDGGWEHTLPTQNNTLVIKKDQTPVTFSLVPYDLTTHSMMIYDSINNPDVQLPESEDGLQTNLVLLTLAHAPDITHILELSMHGYSGSIQVIPRHVLSSDAYTYKENDLGVTLTPTTTSFRLWAPTATDVHVLLFDSEAGSLKRDERLQPDKNGTWYLEIEESLDDWYYLYLVTVQGRTQTAVDPYARACSPNAARGLIVDLTQTDPPGWENDQHHTLAAPVDAIIYEVHVRDFSSDDNSGMQHKGKYLAFTEMSTRGPENVTTGVDHLKELGITHVQIMPPALFASVDETRAGQYNWGYDPQNYNIPEGSYASTPHWTARNREFKQLVQSLHNAGLGVTIDVVYNHTFTTHTSDFDKIVPQYYYRTSYQGQYTNGSGCGNEFATERPMVQKFVRDSVAYWIREYHVDGLRFDLMALIGVDTIKAIAQDLQQIHPDILLYGEPWTGGLSELPTPQLFTKGQQRGQHIAVFNDDLRNALTGSVFNHEQQGYATGAPGLSDIIKQAVIGSIKTFTSQPGEVVNYASCHDNMTLWDKIAASNSLDSEDERIKMDELAQAIVLTAQGIPFIHGGEDFLRTKGGNENSYNAGDSVNQFDWSRKATYKQVFQYYAALIQLRKDHPAFRLRSADDINKQLQFLDSPDNTVAFQLAGQASGDEWEQILVVYNPNHDTRTLTLPDGKWTLIGKQGQIIQLPEQDLQQVHDTLDLEPISCTILYQNS
jgi:pullulanase